MAASFTATPNRWLSVTITSASTRILEARSRGSSLPRPRAQGIWRECMNQHRERGLRWARSTDAEGEGDMRELSTKFLCTGPLDLRSLIDGFAPRFCTAHLVGFVRRFGHAASLHIAYAAQSKSASTKREQVNKPRMKSFTRLRFVLPKRTHAEATSHSKLRKISLDTIATKAEICSAKIAMDRSSLMVDLARSLA